MLTLVQNFVQTYDLEAVSNRETMQKLVGDVSENKLLATCLEQKVHYLERETTKLHSLSLMPRHAA